MNKFGDRLKELRLERGLSIKKLSKLVNLSHSSICRWENNQAEINSYALVILSKFFNVSTDYLLGLEN